jgi:alpha-L-fucosidase 2
MKHLIITSIAFLSTLLPVHAVPQARLLPLSKADTAVPERGSVSQHPAMRWEDAFVSGNGRMGAMLFGAPDNEVIVANHCRLFLPLGNREIVPDLAANVPELRRIIREKDYDEAMKFFRGKAEEQGFPGLIPTDPFHPGLFINIRQPANGPVTGYLRTENFRTGEVTVRWRDNRGEFRRRLFVSRTNNLIVVSLTGPAASELSFPPVSPDAQVAEAGGWTAEVGSKLIHSEQKTTAGWVTYHNVYVKGKGGYDAAVRIISRDKGCDRLLLIRIVPWKTPLPVEQSEAWAYSPDNPDFNRPGIFKPVPALAESSVVAYRATADAEALLPQLKESFAGLQTEYEALLSPHALAHAALFDRVVLDLGGGDDRMKTTEELLYLAKTKKCLPPALMEKMYDAGRYMLICSAGELLPNLQGIWTGSWKPAWSGDFTLDTNVQSAMAAVCSANLSELMEGFFRLMESFYPEWRLNAKQIYGCRGVFTNARASNTALELHWGNWPGVFWTAGCGWLASFFTDYADYTDDNEFLEKRCLPLLREIAAFYEDFLTETDKDGHVVFIPSYNPETGCGINATMDIAVAREMLTKLIAAGDSNSAKWRALLAKLPPYPINANGELAEWPDGRLEPGHRHHSQLYPCYQSFDPIFETDMALRKAAQASVIAKIAGSDHDPEGEQSSFGRVQCGVAAAYLGMAEEAYGRLQVMAVKQSMTLSLITSHEPNGDILNTDGNGGIPQIVNTMLLFSRPGQIDLLPALPKDWPSGKVTGLRARGNLTVDIEWKDGKVTNYSITSPESKEIRVRVNGEIRTIFCEKKRSTQISQPSGPGPGLSKMHSGKDINPDTTHET